MSKKITAYIIFVSAMIGVLYSCTPTTCQDVTLTTVNAGFYRTGTGNQIKADSVTLYGLGRDTMLIYNNVKDIQRISFPLDANSDTSILVLRINDKYDTITLFYRSYPHLVSKECGFTFYHVLDTVFNTSSVLDFLIRNQNITTTNEENIRIFY